LLPRLRFIVRITEQIKQRIVDGATYVVLRIVHVRPTSNDFSDLRPLQTEQRVELPIRKERVRRLRPGGSA
jgi:hypothetical protein